MVDDSPTPEKNTNKKKSTNSKFGLFITIFIFTLVSGFYLVKKIQFNYGCGNHLRRVVHAKTTTLAAEEMKLALNFLRQNEIIKGNTTVNIIDPPDEVMVKNDIGLWYENLNMLNERLQLCRGANDAKSEQVLNSVQVEMCLMRENGTLGSVTMPDQVYLHPLNLVWYVIWWISFIVMIIFMLKYIATGVILKIVKIDKEIV